MVSATDDVFVKVYNDIYVPSAFSPNKDGLNDAWRIDALVAIPEAKVTVYNRYGNIVFETTGNSKEWDGTYKGQALPTGAYAYMIDFKNGSPLKKRNGNDCAINDREACIKNRRQLSY